ncbi:hypothetical protein ACWD5Z_20435 [Micromonospora chokoriensis]
MDEAEALLLVEFLSPERMQPYVDQCSGDLVSAVNLYCWNIEVTAAVQGLFPVLEPALRNAMAARLAALAGRDDWWRPGVLPLAAREAAKVENVLLDLRRRADLRSCDIIPQLTFGFWVALLGREYEMSLWRPALRHAFPGYRGRRGPLHGDLHNLRLLRNRMAHHEPIHHRHLEEDHRKIYLALGYISPSAAKFARTNDRVPQVLARRADVCAGLVPTRF